MVGDGEAHLRRLNPDGLPRCGCLGAVFHEIDKGNAHQILVHGQNVPVAGDFQRSSVLFHDRPGQLPHLCQQFRHGHRRYLRVLFHGKQRQQLSDHGFQPVELGVHTGEQRFLLFFGKVDISQSVHVQEQRRQGCFQLVGDRADKELLPLVLFPKSVHVGLHRQRHPVEIPRQSAHFVLRNDRDALAVIPVRDAAGGFRKPGQRAKRPGDHPVNRPKPQKANGQRQQRKAPAELPELGIYVGGVRRQIHAAIHPPGIRDPAQNQKMPAARAGSCRLRTAVTDIQIAFRVDPGGRAQALSIDNEGASRHAAGTEAVGQQRFPGKRVKAVSGTAVDGCPEIIHQIIQGFLRTLQKGFIGLLPHLPEHGRRQAHRHGKQQRRAENCQFCFQLHRSSNR